MGPCVRDLVVEVLATDPADDGSARFHASANTATDLLASGSSNMANGLRRQDGDAAADRIRSNLIGHHSQRNRGQHLKFFILCYLILSSSESAIRSLQSALCSLRCQTAKRFHVARPAATAKTDNRNLFSSLPRPTNSAMSRPRTPGLSKIESSGTGCPPKKPKLQFAFHCLEEPCRVPWSVG